MKLSHLLLFATLFISCSKPQPKGIRFCLDNKEIFFQEVKFTAEPFCGKKIFSYSSGNLLVSFVADSLTSGTYEGGLNLWGTMTESITINLKSVSSGSWVGERTKGTINI